MGHISFFVRNSLEKNLPPTETNSWKDTLTTMSKKKGKFDFSHLVTEGFLKEGQTLSFVSDPKQSAKITKAPSGEYKLLVGKEVLTVHAFVVRLLGQEPPDHASKWLKDDRGVTLYDHWQSEYMDQAA